MVINYNEGPCPICYETVTYNYPPYVCRNCFDIVCQNCAKMIDMKKCPCCAEKPWAGDDLELLLKGLNRDLCSIKKCRVHILLNESYLFMGDSVAAKAHLEAAANLGSGMAFHELGKLYHDQGDLEKAKKYYHISSSCGIESTHYNLGMIYVMEKRYAKAIDMFQKVDDEESRKKVEDVKKLYFKSESGYRRIFRL